MGSSSSKQQTKQNGRDLSLLHSVSLPANRSQSVAGEEGRKLFWKSSLSSMPKMGGGESSIGSIFRLSSPLRQVLEEDLQEEPSELEGEQVRSIGVSKGKSAKSLRRTVSFQPTWDSSPEPKCSLSQKMLRNEVSGADSTLNLSMKFDSVCGFLPHKDVVMERSAGLRTLLNPVLMPSHNFASPTRPANDPSKALAPRKSFNPRVNESSPGKGSFLARSNSFRGLPIGNNLQTKLELSPDKSSFSGRSSSFCDLPILSSSQPTKMESGTDILAESGGSPLFDPLILATFEKALECLSDDSHQSSDLNSSDNSSSASESESSLDLEGLILPQVGMDISEVFDSVNCQDARIMRSPSMLRASAFLNRKVSFSRVFSLKNSGQNWSGKDYLDRFEMMCPPDGKQKVILYFTSLRAVRKTFEDCCMLRLILKGLRIHVDERDVWMHSKFRKELTEIMGAALPVPRLFISGRYIGGAEEVEQLHEEGILGKMLQGFANDSREECEVCRDVRFIPCTTCFGSCKFFSKEDVVERCPDCNENGLILCPHCDW